MAFLVFDTAASRFHTDKRTNETPVMIRLCWWRSDEPDPVCALIRPPPGTTIAAETLPYHGLVYRDLEHDGQDPKDVIAEMEKAMGGSETILVAFNAEFHFRQLYRTMGIPDAKPPDTSVDVMALATPILAIQSMRPGGGLKSPSLRECCQFFDVQEPAVAGAPPLDVAESTVRAVRAVYEACMSHGQPSAA